MGKEDWRAKLKRGELPHFEEVLAGTFLGNYVEPHPPRMKLVCVDGEIVGDATVIVSPKDPNWYRNPPWPEGSDGEVRVDKTGLHLVRRK
jgi:hypothetical protein